MCSLPGYSAHADREGLLDWIEGMRKLHRQVFVADGEEAASSSLAKAIRERFGMEVRVPEMDQKLDMDWRPVQRTGG